jgi:hypothetical protein
MDESHAVGRAAGPDDLPAVAACLTSAFYDDPVWGSWTFPDEASRTERLYELMYFWAQAGVRHPWVRMTENAEAVAVFFLQTSQIWLYNGGGGIRTLVGGISPETVFETAAFR